MNEIFSTLLQWVTRGLTFGSVIAYGALGETITEKSGNMNLGTPGIMCIGGACGFAATYLYENNTSNPNAFVVLLIGLLAAFLASSLAGALFCLLTTTLRANQNVTGLALTIFGTGLSKFLGAAVIPKGSISVKATFANSVFAARLPFVKSLGFVGNIFFNYGFMLYLSIVLIILAHIFLTKTKAGLKLRAVGENPATADATGINVIKSKYLATIIGAGISGLGGLYYALDYSLGVWSSNATISIEALGWLAVALVIFALREPVYTSVI